MVSDAGLGSDNGRAGLKGEVDLVKTTAVMADPAKPNREKRKRSGQCRGQES